MLIPERQDRTRQLIEQHGVVSLDRLIAELSVSASTVRRDLDVMEKQGLVRRVHGGVIWQRDAGKPSESGHTYAFGQRLSQQTEAKRRIAKAAAGLVLPGQTILLDGGTTVFFLAEHLIGSSLQIVTNSLAIAELFADDDRIELILVGGLLYPKHGVLLGPIAEKALDELHASTLFFSVAGAHGGTLYNQNQLMVQAELKMMRQSQRRVLLLDSEKFDRKALSKLCDLSAISTVITDQPPTGELATQIEKAGCELIVAPQ
jgi:DeoR family transcriptional regulator, fructose operon transcriptional repressor